MRGRKFKFTYFVFNYLDDAKMESVSKKQFIYLNSAKIMCSRIKYFYF